MKIQAVKTRVFKENGDLVSFITEYIPELPERSVLIVTSKVVALSEGRTVICKDNKDKEKTIKQESTWALRTPYTWLTVKDGMLLASAGVDESNADGKIVLLPNNSWEKAEELREILRQHYKISELGVVVTDSRLLPLRAGVVGIALGYAGIKGVRDYRGTKDLFGREFKLVRMDIADSLATAAVLAMGEGAECQPLATIVDAPVQFTEIVDKNELDIDLKEDIYRPFFENVNDLE